MVTVPYVKVETCYGSLNNSLKQASNKQELTIWEIILIAKNKDPFIHSEIPSKECLVRSLL